MNKEQLRKLRREKDLTQKQLSLMSGVSLPTCNRAEKTGKVRLETMQKLLNTLQSHN